MRLLTFMNYRPQRGGITDQILLLADDLKSEGIELRWIDTYGSLTDRFRSVLTGVRKGRNADLIFGVGCAFRGFFPMLVAAVVAALLRKPVLYNFHDGQAEVFLQKHTWWVKKVIGKNQVVVASPFVKNAFQARGFNTKLIPNHFDFDTALPDRTKPFQWNGKILWARSFSPLYQPEKALQAALKLAESYEGCEFHFYGDGPLLDEMRRRYRHPRIHFEGFVERSQFLKEYQNFSVFLNTTSFDNFPLSIMEAGFYRLLVVSSRVGGIASLYSQNEVVFWDGNDPEELVRILSDVLRNPARYERMREQLHQRILTFNWKNVRTKWLNTIREAMAACNSNFRYSTQTTPLQYER